MRLTGHYIGGVKKEKKNSTTTAWLVVGTAFVTGFFTLMGSVCVPLVQEYQYKSGRQERLEWMLAIDAYRINGIRRDCRAIVEGIKESELTEQNLIGPYQKVIIGVTNNVAFSERYDSLGNIDTGDKIAWIVGQMSLLSLDLSKMEQSRYYLDKFQQSISQAKLSDSMRIEAYNQLKSNTIEYRRDVIVVEERCAYLQASIRSVSKLQERYFIEYPLEIEIPINAFSWQTSITARYFGFSALTLMNRNSNGVVVDFTKDDSVTCYMLNGNEREKFKTISVKDYFFKAL